MTKIHWLSEPCSDCPTNDVLISFTFVFLSASTKISLGPAIPSMPTVPKTKRFASAVISEPGPTILLTF